jgi:predicted O-methyltransferase YrrM
MFVRDYIEKLGINLTIDDLKWFDEYERKLGSVGDLERYLLLYALVKYKNCESTLEVGCAGGYGSRAMVIAGAKRVVGIDIKRERTEMGFEFIHDKSENVLPKLNEKFDLIFIDGNHDYPEVLHDIRNCMLLAKKYLVIHDYGLEHGVTQAVNEIFGKKIEIIKDNLIKPNLEAGLIVITINN